MKENLTRSGIKLSPVYGPSDANGDYTQRFGNPGEYPFTRGTRAYSGQWLDPARVLRRRRRTTF